MATETLVLIEHEGDLGLKEDWGSHYTRGLAKGATRFCVECGRAIDGGGCSVLATSVQGLVDAAVRANISVDEAKAKYPGVEFLLVALGATCAKNLGIPVSHQRVLDFDNPHGTSRRVS